MADLTTDDLKTLRWWIGSAGDTLAPTVTDCGLMQALSHLFRNAIRDDEVWTNSQLDEAIWYIYDTAVNLATHDKSTGLLMRIKETYSYSSGRLINPQFEIM